MKRIMIVGGGASGITAGIFAKNKENQVIIVERNPFPLKKLLMTGNGKCNYLNEIYKEEYYHSENPEMISKILTEKNIQAVKDFFHQLGIIPKIKNGYYYPFSNQAITIQKALIQEAQKRGVEIKENTCIQKRW